MSEFNKPELIKTLGILLDLNASSIKDLGHLQKSTLQDMYDNYIGNARASNQAAYKHVTATSRGTTSSRS